MKLSVIINEIVIFQIVPLQKHCESRKKEWGTSEKNRKKS